MFESEFERNLFTLRQEKLKQIEALGQQAYPYRFESTHTIAADPRRLRPRKTGEELEASRTDVAVAGRLMSIRVQGKAGFAHLQQGG